MDCLDQCHGADPGILRHSKVAVTALSAFSHRLTLPSLWAEARSSLREKDKLSLQLQQVNNEPQAVFDLVEQKIADAAARRSTIKRANGEILVVRDVFAKVTSWVKQFIEIGNVVTAADPIHAGLPWAAIRLILQASVNNDEIHVAILEGIDQVCYLLLWSRIEERLYLGRSIDGAEQLEKAFKNLYTNILSFLAKSCRFISQGKFRTYMLIILRLGVVLCHKLTRGLHRACC